MQTIIIMNYRTLIMFILSKNLFLLFIVVVVYMMKNEWMKVYKQYYEKTLFNSFITEIFHQTKLLENLQKLF